MKKKLYLCNMKETTKRYLDSETQLNNQTFHIRKIVFPICIALIILGLGLIGFALYMALSY